MDQNTELKILNLQEEDSLKLYTQLLDGIDFQNPFLRPELITNDAGHQKIPYACIYFEFGEPKILMPLFLRPVEKRDSIAYFDVVSPYGYAGPALKQCVTESNLEDFWKKLDDWYVNNNVISEFIRFSLNGNYRGYNGQLVHTLNNVSGTIQNEDVMWTSFKPKVRNNYRRAVNNDLDFKLYHQNITKDQIEIFYSIYTSTMKRNQAKDNYFFEIGYFENFINKNPEKCLLALVYKDDVAISTELVLIYGQTLYSFLGGTRSDYFHTRPNDFLKINVMKWAVQNGMENYVLGGGRSDKDSLYQYKKSFFPKQEDVVFYTGRKIVLPGIYDAIVADRNPKHVNSGNTNPQLTGFFPKYREPIPA
ncbi:GNAT family N-acetyltransferase [Flagellimonas allohymeniacidonis]|uniref:Peptidoglycan bridge formation glycyltransferase FemA/FemB family protein n=1 Tax=Flagellimonas allohymeniacidonis TaxID=2517819 RepID=A0A4Q8QFC6_9FLAO|nr:GNAT family N-acetyltransferase [Allomuricauda hymeniacidonis]TAI48564.1 peptidoglycan bridge formation glycyltransferase FemA/FemB family protein [Allomuricauda hymeniacidonis]